MGQHARIWRGIREQKEKAPVKITKSQLKQIIKEEITKTLHEVAEDDPSEWGQNVSSYFDELDAYRKLSRVLDVDEEELQGAMDQMGLSIVPAETMASSEEEIEDARLVDQAPEYTDEGEIPPLEEEKKKDDDWIQKAVNPKHKGYCTPMTKKTCTPKRKALAKRFKKAAKKKDKKGGTGWQGKV
jgi:hypothetical protein